MEIQIVENIREKLQVIIQCKQVDSEVLRLKTHIEAFDARL